MSSSSWLFLVAAYLLGSIPSGYMVGLIHRVDVRNIGSRNIGATNVLRVAGPAAGIATLTLDLAKGLIPVLLATHALELGLAGPTLREGAALAAVTGHVFPIFLRFRGGKGVATSLGALVVLSPTLALIAIATFLALLTLSRIVSVASMGSAVVVAGAAILAPNSAALEATVLALSALILWRHRENLHRIRAGTESGFDHRGKK